MADLTGLNERIASWFEPKPAVVNILDTDSKPPRSPKGFWHIGWKYVSIHRVTNFMTPLDFLHDEAANAKLRDAICQSSPFYGIHDFSEKVHEFMPPGVYSSEYYRRAVVLAFCKWAGIPVEEEL